MDSAIMQKTKKDFKIEMDTKKLDKVLASLKQKFVTKIGILGNNTNRDGGTTNAEIGLVHEFGSVSKNIPIRSFLRVPISNGTEALIKAVAKSKKKVEHDMAKGSMKQVFIDLGIKAEQLVQEAFETSGGGTWAYSKGASSDIKTRTVNHKPLIDSGQLRESITSSTEKS